MPFDHETDHRNRLVVVRGRGTGSTEEGIDSFSRLMTDASLDPSYRVMFVVDDVDHEPSPTEVGDIARLIRALGDRFHGRKAIVTARPGRVTTAIMVALSAAREGDVEAFTAEAAAREWLLAGRVEQVR